MASEKNGAGLIDQFRMSLFLRPIAWSLIAYVVIFLSSREHGNYYLFFESVFVLSLSLCGYIAGALRIGFYKKSGLNCGLSDTQLTELSRDVDCKEGLFIGLISFLS